MDSMSTGFRAPPVPADGRESRQPGRHWHIASPRRKAIIASFWVLVVLNVALPKAGFKAGEIPVTFGYIALMIFAGAAVISLLRRPLSLHLPLVQFGAFFLPVTLLIVTKTEAYNMPMTVALVYLVQFLVLPVLVLVILAPFLEEIPADVIGRAIVLAVRFTIAWGLMNFVLFPVIHDIIQIPMITVNQGDYGEILGKNNVRGALMKLVSTYNNGNLYGICMTMLAPIFLLFERSRVWGALLFVALICTLSRTVWFGAATVVVMMMLTGQIEVRRSRVWLAIAGVVMIAALLIPVLGWNTDHASIMNLGGRVRSFAGFELSIFGKTIVTIPELVYFGFLNSFGIIGCVFALGCLAMGPAYAFLHYPSLSPLRRAAFAGACSYMAAAVIDGAFVFPPTMVQFLFLTGLIYRGGLRPDVGGGRLPPFAQRMDAARR